jgi:hypothetical protein
MDTGNARSRYFVNQGLGIISIHSQIYLLFTINYQLSTINYQLSTLNSQLSTLN